MDSILKNYQMILESIEEGVFTVNLDYRILSFNRAAEKITGISRKDAVGRNCASVFRANVCADGCVLRQTIETGKPISNMPVRITCPGEREVPISGNTTVLRATNGRMIGGVEIFRDLSAIRNLQKAYMKQQSFEDIVSKNEKMQNYFSILPQIAESDSTVLIAGDTGTGKELIARAIHNNSLKKGGPFIALNCGAMPDTLIESELFGYKAGAFTDARQDKPGRFALAENGTIFLDEIGDISPAVQTRLLRVLQEKSYEPLGSTETLTTNARVIVATHRNLEQLVKEGRFRQDLYYRINVIKISLPPLCERTEDIPLLVDHFIDRYNSLMGKQIVVLSQEAMTALMSWDWPGNIRELENAIEHAFVLCREDIIGLSYLPEPLQSAIGTGKLTSGVTLKEIERLAILEALMRNSWKKVATARELGIDKNTLRRKIQRLGIQGE